MSDIRECFKDLESILNNGSCFVGDIDNLNWKEAEEFLIRAYSLEVIFKLQKLVKNKVITIISLEDKETVLEMISIGGLLDYYRKISFLLSKVSLIQTRRLINYEE